MENRPKHFHEHQCGFCKDLFLAKRNDAKFCSNTCRQKAYMYRYAEAVVKCRIREMEQTYSGILLRGYLRPGELEGILGSLKSFMKGWAFPKLEEGHDLRKYYLENLIPKYEKLRSQLNR